MFSFSKKGVTLTLGQIDAIAAEFFGKEVSNYWASPFSVGCTANWFEVVGHAIEDTQYIKSHIYKYGEYEKYVEWHYVVAEIIRVASSFEESYDEVIKSIEGVKPFIDLCYHLKGLGIVAHPHGW